MKHYCFRQLHLLHFGAFHVSELVAAGKSHISRTALQWTDVILVTDELHIHLRRSKQGLGKEVILGTCAVRALCPVEAMRPYLMVRGEGKDYLFQHQDRSLLTKFQFWKLTGKTLEKVGLSGWHFGTRSFRIGAASTAVALGYTPAAIKRMGRWTSWRFLNYVRPMPLV